MRWAQLNTETEIATLRQAKQRGFTIVELLIVIVVIAILAAISVVAYTGIQARAHDAQRASDLQAIQKALEMYRAQHGAYPRCGGGLYVTDGVDNSYCPVSDLADLFAQGYLPRTVHDPIDDGDHVYQYAAGYRRTAHGSCTYDNSMNYILGALFEGGGNGHEYDCWEQTLDWHGGSNG